MAEAVREDVPREKDEVVLEVVKDKQYLLYGFLGGLAIAWIFGGMGGENTGYIMVIAVVAYVLFMRKTKKSLPTIADVAREIAMDQKKINLKLDPDGRYLKVRMIKPDHYIFDFSNQHKSFLWVGKLAKGTREMFDQSADVERLERFTRNLDLKQIDITEVRP